VPREQIVVGLDIGTTKVCTVVGHGDPRGKLTIAGVGTVPSRGIKKGVVIDVEDTVAAIRESAERARHMAGVEFGSAVVGVTGEHIHSSNRRGTVSIAGAGGLITADDVDRALQAAVMDVPADREIIHSLPRFFAVDGHRGVRRPIGMCGQRLEVETHVVTGTASFLQNVVQCAERAGLRVSGLVLEPIATSESVATADERELGVALIDIGGGTSDIAVFTDGTIMHSKVIPVGGNHVTRDISIGLRTPFDLAEQLKIESGVASSSMIPHGEALEVMTAGSGERQRLPRTILGEIIEARMSELLEMAREGVGTFRLPAGVILTGGGAMLPGAVELAQEIFQLPVRLGRPIDLAGWGEQVETPQYATAVGLLRFALRQREAVGNPTIGSEAAPAIAPAANGAPDMNGHGDARRMWDEPTPVGVGAPAGALAAIGAGLAHTAGASTSPQLGASPAGAPAPGTSTVTVVSPAAQGTGATGAASVAAEGAVAAQTPFDRISHPDVTGEGNSGPDGVEASSAPTGEEASASWWQKFLLKLRQWIGFEPS
jgi:cell division protein FtsA